MTEADGTASRVNEGRTDPSLGRTALRKPTVVSKENLPTSYSQSTVGTVMGEWLPKGIKLAFFFFCNRIKAL